MPRRLIRPLLDNLLALYAGFAALAALTLWAFIFVNQQIQHYEDARSIVRERQMLYQVYVDLLDAETGQRGYLLTSNKAYLVPYNTAVDRVAADFKTLSDAIVGGDGEQGEINGLRSLADQKLSELRSTIALQDAGRRDQALAVVNDNVGKTIMDRFRASIDGLALRQQQRVDAQFAMVQREGRTLRLGSLAAVVFTIAVGFVSIR